jgi:hypothetical protein
VRPRQVIYWPDFVTRRRRIRNEVLRNLKRSSIIYYFFGNEMRNVTWVRHVFPIGKTRNDHRIGGETS